LSLLSIILLCVILISRLSVILDFTLLIVILGVALYSIVC